jgi:hypothetical protein
MCLERDHESSIMWRHWPTRGCCAVENRRQFYLLGGQTFETMWPQVARSCKTMLLLEGSCLLDCKTRLTNLWHACPKWQATFTAVPIFFYFVRAAGFPVLWRECVCVCIHVHISAYRLYVYELSLLPNKTASETFLHKSVAVRSADWIFIIGVLAWRWLSIRDIGQNVLQCSIQTGSSSSPSYFQVSFFTALLEKVFIINIL